MAPSEEKILSTWLLVPASLQSVMTLGAFTRLFPASQANNPQIRLLYRDLQHQRASLVDAVERNIEAEAARGSAQKRSVLRVRKGPEKEEQDDEVDIEYAVRCELLYLTCKSNNCSCTVQRPTYQPRNHIRCPVFYQILKAQHKIWKLRYSDWTRNRRNCWRRSKL